jgi:hypothetical protein
MPKPLMFDLVVMFPILVLLGTICVRESVYGDGWDVAVRLVRTVIRRVRDSHTWETLTLVLRRVFRKVSRYHSPECYGEPWCNGCGWIDRHDRWIPGPCPEAELPYQYERSC